MKVQLTNMEISFDERKVSKILDNKISFDERKVPTISYNEIVYSKTRTPEQIINELLFMGIVFVLVMVWSILNSLSMLDDTWGIVQLLPIGMSILGSIVLGDIIHHLIGKS